MLISFQLEVNGERKAVNLSKAFCVGYSGRNKEKTFEHIRELAEIGIPEPKEVPNIYPVSMNTITQNERVEVLGNETSGEAEIVIIFGDTEDEVYITVGSDHTDRGLEAVDINKSKQVCAKPFSDKAWKLDDVIGHWDELELSAELFINGKWIPYQNDKISVILSYQEIISYIEKISAPKRNSIYFSGTVPLLQGFIYGEEFKIALKDPVKNDVILANYQIINIER